MSQTVESPEFAQYVDRWQTSRDERDRHRRDPYGYLSYAAFHKLGHAPQRFNGIPGAWRTGAEGPAVELADGETITVDGKVVTGSRSFAPLRERELRRAAQFGDVVIELSKRGGQDLLRPIDPAFGRRLNDTYDHTPAYEPDPRWIVTGEFVPFDDLRPTAVAATVGEIVHVHPAVGEVIFELRGVEQRLLVFARDGYRSGTAGTGVAQFVDPTGGVTTDPLGRSIEISFPAERGPVTLDFNYTRNLQRPYTKYAPCPLPPAQNRLSVAVEAGDQLPVFRP